MYMLVLIKKLITTKVENRFASGKKNTEFGGIDLCAA